jgi:hypothetical protein
VTAKRAHRYDPDDDDDGLDDELHTEGFE